MIDKQKEIDLSPISFHIKYNTVYNMQGRYSYDISYITVSSNSICYSSVSFQASRFSHPSFLFVNASFKVLNSLWRSSLLTVCMLFFSRTQADYPVQLVLDWDNKQNGSLIGFTDFILWLYLCLPL